MDEMGHVNNAVYLSYYESARIDLFKKCSFTKIPFIMVSAKIDYIKQIHHPSSLVIASRIEKVGKTSFDIKSAIFKDDDKNCSSITTITCVCYDYQNQIKISVPDSIKKLI
ncbi:MAG: hypothetical protein CMG07_06355 [Candidatus Marinimicrobia bacterium]|nr:hypothetical protein [Candidatus Neomarinimicrobiota bacterium]|tara:strand:- start:27 stop:359 length:333 start_codon:yes stop_codon:yes gene_type:complete